MICSLLLEVNFKSETGGSKIVNFKSTKIGNGMRTGNGNGIESGKNFIVNSKADADRIWENLTGGKKPESLEKTREEKSEKSKVIRLPSQALRRRPFKAWEIKPKTLTDAILLIINNWNRVARNLSEKKIVLRNEIFQEGVWIFQVKWMIKALLNEFPSLIENLYEKERGQAGLDRKRLKSSVTSIMSQSLKAFEIMEFVKDLTEIIESQSRSYSVVEGFLFEELKRIYNARKAIEKIDNQEAEGLIVGKDNLFYLKQN